MWGLVLLEHATAMAATTPAAIDPHLYAVRRFIAPSPSLF
jgi:hypothetical protein